MKTDIIGVSVGVIGIVIGVIVSYYFYRKGIRVKEPCWAISSNNLIQGYKTALSKLKVLYQDKEVENITISKILFWNNGVETINNTDIETVNRLKVIGLEDIKFLDAKILAYNNQSSQCNVRIVNEESWIYLDFDYLDQKQGCVIQVVHTGKSSEDIKMIGDIKGAKSLLLKTITKEYELLTKLINAIFGIYLTGFGIFGLLRHWFILFSLPTITPDPIKILVYILYCAFGIPLIFRGLGRWRGFGIAPKGLETFQSD